MGKTHLGKTRVDFDVEDLRDIIELHFNTIVSREKKILNTKIVFMDKEKKEIPPPDKIIFDIEEFEVIMPGDEIECITDNSETG